MVYGRYIYPYGSQLGLLFPTEWKVIKFHGSSHHQADGNGKWNIAMVIDPIFSHDTICFAPPARTSRIYFGPFLS